MEGPEVPLESTHEELHHRAEHSEQRWVLGVALSAAFIAAVAAVGSLLAGHQANEAVIDQVQASDQWNYYQAKGVKANILASKLELLRALDRPVDQKDEQKIQQYATEQEEIKRLAEEKQSNATRRLTIHSVFARSVTMFQVAIAVAAISVLTKRPAFWYVSLGFALIGIWFFCSGLLWMR
jgi:heme/copper-type cytochrome/quinol oxidase subunit 4